MTALFFEAEPCNSTPVVRKPRTRTLARWTHIRICSCGYSTPITTDGIARYAMRVHNCDRHIPRADMPAQLELPFDLPEPAAVAVVRYLADRRNRTQLDVDPVLVRRFIDGDYQLRLNTLERVAVYTLLRQRGTSKNECAALLRLSWSTQARYRRILEDAA